MLARWDPFREMMVIRNTMDRMFDSALTGSSKDWEPYTWNLALDVAENQDEFLVKASLPGVSPENVEVTFSNNTLTIKGEIKEEKEVEATRYHLRERHYGSFSRSITLPSGIAADKIQANFEAGVLELHLPKVEEVKPKKITIHTSESPKVIEANATNIKNKN
jgi:HSP20 family protein